MKLKRVIKEDIEIQDSTPINFGSNGLPDDPRIAVDPIFPQPTMLGGVAPDTTELDKEAETGSGDGMVETDSNTYVLTQVVENFECERENCQKSVGLLYDEINLKKFFVFVCDSSLMFKRFSTELENFTRTICYDELKQAMVVFNKVVDYINNNQNIPDNNSELIRNALSAPASDEELGTEAPQDDEALPDFSNKDDFEDYYDNKEPGQEELGVKAEVSVQDNKEQ